MSQSFTNCSKGTNLLQGQTDTGTVVNFGVWRPLPLASCTLRLIVQPQCLFPGLYSAYDSNVPLFIPAQC